jgi:hypothetical protein
MDRRRRREVATIVGGLVLGSALGPAAVAVCSLIGPSDRAISERMELCQRAHAERRVAEYRFRGSREHLLQIAADFLHREGFGTVDVVDGERVEGRRPSPRDRRLQDRWFIAALPVDRDSYRLLLTRQIWSESTLVRSDSRDGRTLLKLLEVLDRPAFERLVIGEYDACRDAPRPPVL